MVGALTVGATDKNVGGGSEGRRGVEEGGGGYGMEWGQAIGECSGNLELLMGSGCLSMSLGF